MECLNGGIKMVYLLSMEDISQSGQRKIPELSINEFSFDYFVILRNTS